MLPCFSLLGERAKKSRPSAWCLGVTRMEWAHAQESLRSQEPAASCRIQTAILTFSLVPEFLWLRTSTHTQEMAKWKMSHPPPYILGLFSPFTAHWIGQSIYISLLNWEFLQWILWVSNCLYLRLGGWEKHTENFTFKFWARKQSY